MKAKNSIELGRIEQIRERLKISRKDMADAVRMTEDGYRYKERNGSFALKDLPPLADMFGMSIEELVRELNPAYMSEEEARAAHYRSQSLEEMANPFQFMEALFERRSELQALLGTDTTPKTAKKGTEGA